jgi:hypothetical protein
MRSIAALKLVGIATDLPSRRTRRRAEAAGVHILVAISGEEGAARDCGQESRRPGRPELVWFWAGPTFHGPIKFGLRTKIVAKFLQQAQVWFDDPPDGNQTHTPLLLSIPNTNHFVFFKRVKQ